MLTERGSRSIGFPGQAVLVAAIVAAVDRYDFAFRHNRERFGGQPLAMHRKTDQVVVADPLISGLIPALAKRVRQPARRISSLRFVCVMNDSHRSSSRRVMS